MRLTTILFALFGLAGCAASGPDRDDMTGPSDCAVPYKDLIGSNIAALSLPDDLKYRIIYPGMAVTMDYNPERVNIEVTDSGVITRVSCG